MSLPSSIIPVIIKEGSLVSSFEAASWLATCFAITAVPSSIIGGILSDKFGRRKIAMLSMLPLLTGLILISTTNSFPLMIIGRCLSSLGVWIGFPSANVLLSEVVHPNVRGTLGVIPTVFVSAGLCLSYLLGYLLTSWRTMVWILLFQPICTFIALFFMKESPYWLIKKDRKNEAETCLQWYRGTEYEIQTELDDLVKKNKELALESTDESTLSIVFSTTFFKAQLCSGLLMFCYQLTGIPALVMFLASVFQDAELSFDPSLAPVLIGITRIVIGIFSSVAMKTGNRRNIFCFCSFILCLCCSGIAGVSYYRKINMESPVWLGYLPFILILTMFMAHSFGLHPVITILTSEVFPTAIRSLGNGTTTCLGMGGTAIISAIYPYILSFVGVEGCFLVFSLNSLLLTLYAFCIIPDFRKNSF